MLMLSGVLTRVPLGRLKDSNSIVGEMEEHYKPAVHVNGPGCVHASYKSENIAVKSMTISFHKLLEVSEEVKDNPECGGREAVYLRGALGMRLRQDASESS